MIVVHSHIDKTPICLQAHFSIPVSMAHNQPQTTQTAYLLSQDGLRRPIVDPARHATFLR